MLDLSPTKLLIIFIVAVVLLGPRHLPQVARQLGAAWRKLVGAQRQVEQELRQKLPDLPSSHDIARFARSPVMILNQFARMADGSEDTVVQGSRALPRGCDSVAVDDASCESPGPCGAATDWQTSVARPSDNAPGTPGRGALGERALSELAARTDDPTMN